MLENLKAENFELPLELCHTKARYKEMDENNKEEKETEQEENEEPSEEEAKENERVERCQRVGSHE